MRASLLSLTLAGFLVLALTASGAACTFTIDAKDSRNRVTRVTMKRGEREIATIKYSHDFGGYFVECTSSGVPPKQFHTRAKDAGWHACGWCK